MATGTLTDCPKTLHSSELGKAKKQRDKLRNQLRTDVNKFCKQYPGISRFEVVHAIVDTVLKDLDATENHAMPNNLSQAKLPYVEALVEAAAASEQSASKEITGLNSLFQGQSFQSLIIDDLAAPIGASTAPKKLKADKDVTAADVTELLAYKTGVSGYSVNAFKEALEYCRSAYGKENCLTGSGYESGPMKVIYYIKPSSPYLNYSTVQKYGLIAPSGMKLRKLKNKPFYKLVSATPVPKVKITYNGGKATVTTQSAKSIDPYGPYLINKTTGSKIPVPLGYKLVGQYAKVYTPSAGYVLVKDPTSDNYIVTKWEPPKPLSGPVLTHKTAGKTYTVSVGYELAASIASEYTISEGYYMQHVPKLACYIVKVGSEPVNYWTAT